MVVGLKKINGQCEKNAARQQCVALTDQIVEFWPECSFGCHRSRSKFSDCQRFISLLKILKALSLTRALLTQVLPKDHSPISATDVVALCKPIGWTDVGDGLVELFEQTQEGTLERNANLLEAICVLKESDEDRLSVCVKLAQKMVDAVKRFDTKRGTNRWDKPKVNRVKLLDNLFKSLFVLGDHDSLDTLVNHVTSKPKK